MFRMIKKTDYWEGHTNFPDLKGSHGLKHVQDVFVLNQLIGVTGATICEIGGGTSRVLKQLKPDNECWNIDKLEGAGNGPLENLNGTEIRLIREYIGDFSTEIPASYFDYVISVSVIEHISAHDLDNAFTDCLRILKDGGIMIHAIDLYLPDHDDPDPCTAYHKRIRAYRKALDTLNGKFAWLEPPELTTDPYSSARYASNSDLTLHGWNQFSPGFKDVRARSQSCSLAVGCRKTGQAA